MPSTTYCRCGMVSALLLLSLLPSYGVSAESHGSPETAQGTTKVVPALPACAGNDDTAAMQDWLDHASLSRATFVVPSTVQGCKILKPLRVSSNTHVVQHGRVFAGTGYAIPSGESAQSGMYTIVDGAHDVVIEGAGKLDGNFQSQAAGIATAGSANSGYGSNVTDVALLGLTIENMGRSSVSIGGTAGIRLDGLTVRNSAKGVRIGHGTSRAIATNLWVSWITSDDCFAFLNGATDSSLSSSIVHNCTGVGVRALTAAGVAAANRDLLIDNNIVYAAAIGIQTLSEGAAPSSVGVNVTSNQLHGNAQYGIGLLACDNCQATANLSHLNGSSPNGYQPGIFVSNSRGIKLSSNTVRNEGQGTTTGIGIVLQDTLPGPGRETSQRIVVTGNFIYDDQPTTKKTMISPIAGLTNPVVITGNVFGPGLTGISPALCASPSICTNNQVMP